MAISLQIVELWGVGGVYTKYISPLKTRSKQKELEWEWNQITKDPEWIVALQKRKIV